MVQALNLKQIKVLLVSLVLSIKELETNWPAQSQDNGLGLGITAYLLRGVSEGKHYEVWLQVVLAQDVSSTHGLVPRSNHRA